MKAKVNEVSIYYEIQGDGRPLVLIHGLGSDRHQWDYQIPEFSKAYKVIVYDVRGHGESDKPHTDYSIELFADDMAILLRSLGLKSAFIVGLSMGGMITQAFALKYPQMADAIVLYDTTSNCRRYDRSQLFKNLASLAEEKGMAAVLKERRRIQPRAAKWPSAQVFREAMLKNDPLIYASVARAVARFNLSHRLGEIACPTLIVEATQNPMFPPPTSEVIHHGIPNSEMVVLEEGHLPNIDKPEDFNRVVMDFLAKVKGK